ncbi:TPA: hypothetical protein DCL30_02115 [Candidatus Peribacteria bacterium]|nr:hypothetical protein [Candidatus Peribacteria bacterium]HAS33928.1 hypothetical protein [Candidatus Peribacteria bacterium]
MLHRLSTAILTGTLLFFDFALFPSFSSAQGMMGFSYSSPDNAAVQSQQQEEQEGKQFLDNLKNKTVICSQLQDADFEKIGEYFMGQSIGDTSRHIAMNERIKSMMGEQGEEQMHIAWGKRGSSCDTSAAFPSEGIGFMPMMMGGAWNGAAPTAGRWPNGSDYSTIFSMMGYGFGFAPFGFLFMILWWILIIVGIIALVKWIARTSGTSGGKSPIDILKERYAEGGIDKKEFEERKKNLT